MSVVKTRQVPASAFPFSSEILYKDRVIFTGSDNAGPSKSRVSKEKETKITFKE
jgi:hypothetical protein